ncbi:PH domain-containing protein, partial [Staphylococcus haemolyticus]|nr:PH domain-containing protein [Staphylococcus haemolyticus]
MIFCAKRLSGYDSEIFHYSKISTFELSKILMWNTISFYSSGNKVSMKWVNDKDLDKFIELVNRNVKGSNISLGF